MTADPRGISRRSFWLALLAAGCGGTDAPLGTPAAARRRHRGNAVEFAYRTLDGGLFSGGTTRGRPTLVAFLTTFDLASQVQAKEMNKVLLEHRPPIHAGGIVLEPEASRVLVEAFARSLGLKYPLALAGELPHDGAFGRVDHVPVVVALNESGVEVWRKSGLASPRELYEALAIASR